MTEWEAAERTEGLPRGTVTLLFTDIEGSTRRWQEYGEEMRRAVGVHDDIHRRAIEAEGGVVVKHTGDGFMAAFADADSAVRAAVVTQRALSDRTWDPLPPLRVRMGLHTGAVHPTGRDYFGPVVNRAARVGDVGHGGQIIVSAATAALLDPTDEIELRSRGLTRLKDLGEPVELFQVLAPGLDHEAVPLRALADPGGVFPTSASSFVGRTQELRTISALLDEQRLVSVVGPGGVGKSRLSIQAAAEVADRFGDGVVFIELAAAEAGRTSAVVRDQLAASPAVAHPPVDDDPQQAVVRSLGRSEVLMVIDNCEHVVEDVALLVDAVLGACPSTRVLVTSRGPLHLRGESVVQLQTLPVDDAGGPARDLFLERSSDAGVAIDDADTMDDIDRICRLVDGLPLAIELAAAQVVHITPAELARRLERHQAGLVAHDPTVPERHRTIDQLLQWSEDLIDDDALELLLRMSVSAGPMPLATIEGAFADDDGVVRREDVVRLLGALIGQSLVELRRDDGTYGMLGMVRSYCRQQLVEPHAWQRRLTEWCAEALSDAVATDQEDGLAQTMGQVGREVLAGFEWALDEGDGELACRIGAALWPWYEMAGRVGDGRAALGRAVELGTSDAATLGRAYSGAGSLAIAVGDAVDALALHRKAVETLSGADDEATLAWARNGLATARHLAGADDAVGPAREALDAFAALGDKRGAGHAHVSLGLIARSDGDEAAEDHFLEALSLFRLGRHRRDAASVLANLGNLAQDRGDLLRASRFLDGAIQLYREIGDRRGAGLVLVNMSIVAERRRDHRRSVELADEAIDEFRATRDDAGLGAAQHNLGNLLLGDGQVVEGLRALDDATESFRRAGDARGVIMTLESLGRAADSVGARSMAWRCRIDRAIILTRLGLERARRSALDQLVLVAEKAGCEPEAAAIGRLADADGTEVERVLQAMRVLGPGDEVDEADTGAASTPVPSRELLDLTARERELLQFVGAGLDNGEIADRMYISKRTVDSHLSHIRTKLGVTDRAKLVVLAREQLA